MRVSVFFLLLGSLVPAAAADKDLRAFYARSCAACHGLDGTGRTASGQRLPGRALNDPRWQARGKDSDLVRIILQGKRSMPGYKGQLTEADAQRMVAEIIRPMAARKK